MDTTYLDTIGNTPLVRIERCLPERAKGARLLLKLEMQNPGGSVKDRIAKSMIESAEKSGDLKKGMTVVEFTSGNTGIGLAMVCAAKGYKCLIIMPQLPSYRERVLICRQFGAEVHLTAPAAGFAGMKKYTEALMEENAGEYWLANQFYNEDNPAVHMDTTGPEIWKQSGGIVDYFVTGVGTGGTAAGAGKFLTEKNPDCKVICVEPTESRVHVGEEHSPHTILGIGAGVPTHFLTQLDPGKPYQEGPRGYVSQFASCTSHEAILWATKLAKEEGIMVGPSSGATLKVAVDLASREEAAGNTIVVVCASHAIRYTDHPLWAAAKDEVAQALPSPPNLDKHAPLLLWKSSN